MEYKMTQENEAEVTVADVQAESPETKPEKKKNKEPKIDKDGRIDSRLPLDADLFFDIKDIARIRRLSKIALITQYVVEGYSNDLAEHKQLLQSKKFTPRHVKAANAIKSISSGNSSSALPEEISEASDDEEFSGGTTSGSDD